MRKLASLLFTGIAIVFSNYVNAQFSGDNIFLPGHYVQVAIAPNGSFGSTVALPSGYYHSSPSIYVYDPGARSATTTSARLAFIYDAGHDGWTTGTPNFFGDYTLPGTPYEGWNMQIGSSQGNAFYQNYQSYGASGFTGGLSFSGSNTSYTNSGGHLIAVWNGTAGSGGAIAITQTTQLDTNASWINVTTKFKNTSSSTVSNIYYMRAFDPDNDQTASGGSFSTTNTINYQNDYYHRVMITAAGTRYTTQTVSLATKDCRAKCFSGTWPTGGNTCSQYYSQSVSGTIYSGSHTGDYAIGLVYNLGSIAAGDSTSITYSFIFNGLAGLDSAVTGPQLVANGTVLDSADTITPCSALGDTIHLDVLHGDEANWTGSTWRWTPHTGLAYDTGVHNILYMDSLTGVTTYTITGTDSVHGMCGFKQYVLTVVPTSVSGPTVSDVYYCVGATPSPVSAVGTDLLWYTSATGGTGTTLEPTPSTSVPDTITYWVTQTIGGCESARVPLNVYVRPGGGEITGASDVCEGSTILMSDTSVGTWSISASSVASINTISGVVTGVSTGTATVTYTFTSGCYVTHDVTVNVTPAPIVGPTSVCIGSAASYTDATTGGTWTNTPTTYGTIGSSTGSFTGTASGTTILSYTLSTGCGVTDTISINPLPAVITGPAAVCVGSAITLGSTTSGGTWSSSATTVASVVSTSGVVTGISSGSATISYTLPTGCYRTSNVTVNPIPASISGVTSLCASGGSTTLSNTTTGGVWSCSNTAVATVGGTTGVVTGRVAGTATITYSITSTGCYVTTSITVNPLPKVINGPSAVCVGSTITLTDSVPGGTWISGNTSIATIGSTTGIVGGVSAGTVLMTYNLGSGCSITKSITVNPLPAAIGGALVVCETEGTTTATDITSGGTWSTSTPTLLTIDPSTGVINGLSSGTGVISYTLTSTGCAVAANVTINPLPSAISGSTVVCEGSTVTFTDGGGGTWSSSNPSVASVGSTSGAVSGVSTGTATITYTLPTSCYITQDVYVNPLPASITGTTNACATYSTTLSDATTGGVWISSNISIATVSTTGDVTGVSAGTATITYQLGTGCEVYTNVTINALPAAIGGPADVCLNATISLSETTTGGTWASANASVASINTTGSVRGNSVGSTTITYTITSTGCYITHPVTVNSLPGAITGPTNVCVASSIGLSDGSGTWASSNIGVATINSASGVATGVAAGSATITFTDGNGCTATRGITVDPLPNSISGTLSVCEGFSTTLTDASSGGSWSSANTSVATINATTGAATGVTAGTVNITYTLPTGCLTVSSLTVNVTPPAPTGTTDVCEAGSTTTLTDASLGGTWTSGSTARATVGTTTGVVTGISAGAVTITYTLGSCFSTTTVNVRPLPGAIITPLGDTDLCPGDYVTFTANTGTGYTYQWYLGAAPISGETDDYYVVSAGGSYRVAVTSGYGCLSTSSSMRATYFTGTATLTASSTSFCAGSSAPLTCGITGAGLTFQWMNSGVGIPGATNSTFYATRSGDYTVMVSNAAGCYITSAAITMTANPVPPATLHFDRSLSFCMGDTITFSTDTSSTITSVQWLVGGAPIAGATGHSLVVTTPGIYSYIDSNAYGCASYSAGATVTVWALPNANIVALGATSFCAGGSVTLQAATAAGNTYQWFKDGTLISGATNTTYVATTTGYYTVRVTAATGCINTSARAMYVEAITTPSISPFGTPTFCWGGHAELGVTVGTSSAVTYQWVYAGTPIPGATNRMYSTNIPGDYTCQVVVAGGCTALAVTIHVVEYPVPNPVIVFDGYYLKTTRPFVSYQWFRNMIPIASTPRIVPTLVGDYTVRVVDTNGCQTISPIYTLRELWHNKALSMNTVTAESVNIYPNPVTDIVHIEANGPVNALVATMDGKQVAYFEGQEELDLSKLATGMYLIKLYDQQGNFVKAEKLVKQ